MTKNALQQTFTALRTREEIEHEIQSDPYLRLLFQRWKPEQQEEFLDFCTGNRGVRILYDSFFKEIYNPEYTPERLENMLSTILKQPIKILQVLPNDSTRIADESSLLVTDIIVELENHSIANVEVQKIGYMFPGQRCACYSADMLLRQYKRIRSKQQDNFSYRNVKTVYAIIFFERSTKEFHRYPNIYQHHFSQRSDSGLEMELLQEYYFIPLDIFRKSIHNKGIHTELDAWLTFLACYEPEDILALLKAFPQFKALYEDIYELCRNTERVMNMFSKELLELDRKTVQYMVDVMQDEIDQNKKTMDEQLQRITEQQMEIQEKDQQIQAQSQQIQTRDQQIQAQSQQIQTRDQQIQAQSQQIQTRDQQIQAQSQQIQTQALYHTLYTMLSRDDRLTDLSLAVRDEAYREQLLKEYQLIKEEP